MWRAVFGSVDTILSVPGDIMGVDARTGEVLWKFHTTGEPLWPIEERVVMQTQVPGDYAATSRYPTWPAPLDTIAVDGLTEDHVLGVNYFCRSLATGRNNCR